MTFYRKKTILWGITIFIIAFALVFEYVLPSEKNGHTGEGTEVVFSRKSGFYEEPFELELTAKSGTIYYTLDGTTPDKNSIKYEGPVLIADATDNENVYSMRTDVSAGFDKEEIKKISFDDPGYQVPNYMVDKATIIRAVAYDELGNHSEVTSASYFVGFSDKDGYKGMKTLSLITEPSHLFDYETGIYVTGKTYDEYEKEYRGTGEWYWREEFWALWMANYRNRGIKWERTADIVFFDQSGHVMLEQECGIRIHGGISRGYNPKSLNIYARKEYDGNKRLQADLFGTGYYPSTVTLFQGGNDTLTKSKDYLICQAISDLNISTMNYEPYVLFLNGEYWGVYWLNEKYDSHYFAYYYNVKEDNVILIKNGELEDGEEENYKYYSRMLEFCSGSDLTKPENYQKVCDMIDINSCIDYYAMMIYIGRTGDWPDQNYSLWRVEKSEKSPYGDGKWRWNIFDLNSSAYISNFDPIEYVLDTDAMFQNLMTNDTFRMKLLNRTEELANTAFAAERMNERIDEFLQLMTEPMRENDRRFFNDASLSEFHKEIESLRNFFNGRKGYLTPILDGYR